MNDAAVRQQLEQSGTLDAASLDQADQYARARRRPLAEAIVELGLLPDVEVYRKGVAPAAGLKFVDIGSKRIPEAVVQRLPAAVALENRTVPVAEMKGVLFVAIDDPDRVFVLDNLGFVAGGEVRAALCTPAALQRALEECYGDQQSVGARGQSAEALGDEDEDAPIIRLVHKTIEEAMTARASDVHVEPFEGAVRVRYRVDGVLNEIARHPKNLQGSLTSRLKIMANLDIAEKRKPQDGRILFRAKGKDIDIRTSILPSNHGETIVMRLLDRDAGLVSLGSLGFSGADHETFQRLIKRPNGIFLVTGPTGSGKTTTLYAALRELNRADVKIITAEDPVEYHIAGINQCQVRHQIGLNFARILRAMLRQAPNIILVGEIRDPETAEIAIQAALTGHLVFSTLHTNDAPSALARLIDMGVKPFLVAASIQAVLAQRLVRVLCQSCKVPHEAEASELRQLGLTTKDVSGRTLYQARGCESCSGSGYRGRRGIFEMMVMDDEIREMTFRREPTMKIRGYAETSAGLQSLVHDGARKVVEGLTSIDEVLRVVAAV